MEPPNVPFISKDYEQNVKGKILKVSAKFNFLSADLAKVSAKFIRGVYLSFSIVRRNAKQKIKIEQQYKGPTLM